MWIVETAQASIPHKNTNPVDRWATWIKRLWNALHKGSYFCSTATFSLEEEKTLPERTAEGTFHVYCCTTGQAGPQRVGSGLPRQVQSQSLKLDLVKVKLLPGKITESCPELQYN